MRREEGQTGEGRRRNRGRESGEVERARGGTLATLKPLCVCVCKCVCVW